MLVIGALRCQAADLDAPWRTALQHRSWRAARGTEP